MGAEERELDDGGLSVCGRCGGASSVSSWVDPTACDKTTKWSLAPIFGEIYTKEPRGNDITLKFRTVNQLTLVDGFFLTRNWTFSQNSKQINLLWDYFNIFTCQNCGKE